MTVTYYAAAPGQPDAAARMTTLGAIDVAGWAERPAISTPLPAVFVWSPSLGRFSAYTDDGRLTAAQLATDPIVAEERTAGNGGTLQQRALQALAANTTFLAAAKPATAAAQASAAYDQTVRVTRQVDALIKLTLGALDDVSGT